MSSLFSTNKEVFISSINFILDTIYNSINIMDLKREKNEKVDEEEYSKLSKTAGGLENLLTHCKIPGLMTEKDEREAIAALGTTSIYLEYLSNAYAKAARTAKDLITKFCEKN